ncbi:hypothetical protein [Gimesia aquarii]|uniref:Rhamnogalacturonan lyase domain-containing protein n=1 Tax=Gimesia aquarii TaxID=2527964 RepID=A0A517WTF8_9PLAN|nr:hypothetical protein [Gimesia aquarii]QDU08537.1 hypothetical protein V202x_19060 [Gimesia aquarii]
MQKMNFSQIIIGVLLVSITSFLAPANVSAAGWGSVTGQFVFDGPVPKPTVQRKKGDPAVKDAAVCASMEHLNNDLVVNPENKGIQNVFMYMRRAKKIHPDLKSSKEKKVVFDQKGCTFAPHALIVRTDQVVNVKSDDGVAHNTHTYPIKNQAVNFILAPNDRTGKDVANVIPEILPMQVKCDIHPWMTAYWFVVDHPYAVVSDKDGKFTIENLPEGKNDFRIWHEKVGYVERKFTVDIKPGETIDLGQIKISPAKFK